MPRKPRPYNILPEQPNHIVHRGNNVTDQRVASSAEVVVVVGDRAAVSNSKA